MAEGPAPGAERSGRGLLLLRYGIPAALICAGLVCLLVAPEGSAFHGWALFTGAGLSVLLLNVLYRIGVRGDFEREDEEAARTHFAEHGEWPDATAPEAERQWRLPEGIATPESEEAAEAGRHGTAARPGAG